MADINWQQLLSGLAPLISGTLDLTSNPQGQAQGVADIADPFRGQRPQYMDQLHALMTGPNQAADFLKDPSALHASGAWQSGMAAGTDAVNRAAGSRGMAASGNRLTDLFGFGERYDQSWQDQIFKQMLGVRDQQFNELLPLTGATTGSPGTAANAVNAGNLRREGNTGSGIAGLAGGIGSLLNSGVFGKLFDLMKGAGIDTSSLQDLMNNPGNDDMSGWMDQFADTFNQYQPIGQFTVPDMNTFDPIDLSTIFGP